MSERNASPTPSRFGGDGSPQVRSSERKASIIQMEYIRQHYCLFGRCDLVSLSASDFSLT
jgi:hypothetical protein